MSLERKKTRPQREVVNQQRLDPTCPQCGATIPLTVGEAARAATVRCPQGHQVRLDADLERKVRGIHRQLDDLLG